MREDPETGVLVLGAGTDKSGPGPLVTHIAREAANYPVPFTIIPGGLADADFDALT